MIEHQATDAKGRAYRVGGGWVVVHVGAHQAARLASIAWWRLAPDTLDDTVWCLDLAVGERLLKLYFQGEAEGLSWVERWIGTPRPT